MNVSGLPIAVVGAGPIGLAAAAYLLDRGETPLVLEADDSVGASVLEWAHVRVFSPWGYNLDTVATSMLQSAGWTPRPPTICRPGEISSTCT